jgi:mRNA degradation ribonuclease J1/J2
MKKIILFNLLFLSLNLQADVPVENLKDFSTTRFIQFLDNSEWEYYEDSKKLMLCFNFKEIKHRRLCTFAPDQYITIDLKSSINL